MDSTLEKINKAALKFLVPLTFDELYKNAVLEAQDLVNCEYGSIVLEQDGKLQRVYSTLPPEGLVKIRKKGFTYKAYQEKKILVVHSDEFGEIHPELKKLGIQSNVFIPLSYKSKCIGVLVVNCCKKRVFAKEELDALSLYGSMVSLAIRKTELFNQMQEALNMRDLFISLAAHELRTPLTSVNGYVQLLYSRLNQEDSVLGKWVRELHVETQKLTRLVGELLTLNLIKGGHLQFNFKQCNLAKIIQRAIKNYQFINPDRKILFYNQLDQEDAHSFIGDPDKLLQVLNNLIENADKFSPQDKNIEIYLKSRQRYFVVKVVDHGKGIPKKDLTKVFDGFYKGSDHTVPGLGVGLFLSKHVVNRHGGKINVNSTLSKGTTIEIKLPQRRILT